MDYRSFLPVLIIGGFLLFVYYNSTVPETINGKTVVDTKTNFELIKNDKAVDNHITIKHVPSNDTVDLFTYNDLILIDDEKSNNFKIKNERYKYFFDQTFGVGVFGGYEFDSAGDGEFEYGLKLNYGRLLFNYVSVDGLVTEEEVGVGVTVYPLPEHWGDNYKTLGVGYGRLFDYDDFEQSNIIYMSLSIDF
jgi:hypothetical protein